jgi:hypothetical protein
MPGNLLHLHYLEPTLEQATGAFVTEVVKVEILDLCPSHNPPPRRHDGIVGDRKYAGIGGALNLEQNLEGALREGDCPVIAILRTPQRHNPPAEINIVPL